MIHLEVAVAAPLEHTLTYALSDSALAGSTEGEALLVGRRVLVPLGRRRVTGYILASFAPAGESAYRIRPISSFADQAPLFHAAMVPFFRWVAGYYQYSLGLVIKAALPAGLAPKSVRCLVLQPGAGEALHAFGIDPLPDWLARLADQGELSAGASAALVSDAGSRKLVRKLLADNVLCWQQFLQPDAVKEKTELVYTFAETTPRPAAEGEADRLALNAYRKELQGRTGIPCSLAEARALHSLASLAVEGGVAEAGLSALRQQYRGAPSALAGLAKKGLVRLTRRRQFRIPETPPDVSRPLLCLTRWQQIVLDRLSPAIEQRAFAPFLLHGVTGSGKTEVYLQASAKTLEAGRDVLILVPEIALAGQLAGQLLERFPGQVVLLHSGLSAAERFDQYFLALTGQARVVIGARSAVFAPLPDPGLIIVDEEHDGGYKQDDSFSYHGRDLAVLRGQQQGAVVLLGSATPSFTSYSHALSGKYGLLELPERVGERPLPSVAVVRMGGETPRESGRIIGTELLQRLRHTLAAGKQAILLLNRRGFSAVLLCQGCGTAVQCSHCHVSLTLHKGKDRLICHYCGFQRQTATLCSNCRGSNLVPVGFGTERVEEEVRQLLPEARLERLDSDTASDRKKMAAVLRAMHSGRIDILIGTQMIAKGHHFPQVTLVGVVWADGGMNMPDFRAAERTFQLIAQVTGRAGRGDSPGEVVIQTLRPEHYAIEYAREHRYREMFQHEMELRRHPAFPPYVRLTLLRLVARAEGEARASAGRVARFCRQLAGKEGLPVETLGPAPSPLDKIKDLYRWQVLLKGQGSEPLGRLCTALRGQQNLLGSGCSLAIDVDPENML